MTVPVLIIEDDTVYASTLARIMRHEGFAPTIAHSGEQGLEKLSEAQPVVVLVDLDLPGISGIDVIRSIREAEQSPVCIVVSGLVSVETSVAAMKAGAHDIIQKTSGVAEIGFRLKKALEIASLQRQMRYLQDRDGAFEEIIGESHAMLKVKRRIRDVALAPSSTVLIAGETGTGKELVARAVHRLSERRKKPLVSVNCAAVPETLLESEFFGHERGAFTGASQIHHGLFETAHGGTLFLDEISELDLRLQAKLLRIIEEKCFKRVGGVKELEVDVRLIAATNKNLEKLVADSRFREDLLYRLNVFQIDVPPLRERGEDITLLAEHFMRDFGGQMGKQMYSIDPIANKALCLFRFPGNVRQLRNLIEQSVILAPGDTLTADLLRGLGPSLSIPAPSAYEQSGPSIEDASMSVLVEMLGAKKDELRRFERSVIDRALGEADGNKTKAADLLGMSRYALLRRIRSLSE